MGLFDSLGGIGGIANLATSAYQIYNNERARDDIQNNPGTANSNAIVAALMDPNNPRFQSLVEDEKQRQYRDIVDYIQRSDIMRRRAAARGSRVVRSEREDESRHKALIDALGSVGDRANDRVVQRLTGSARANDGLSTDYLRNISGATSARNNTVAVMNDLARVMSRNMVGQDIRTDSGGSSDVMWGVDGSGWTDTKGYGIG